VGSDEAAGSSNKDGVAHGAVIAVRMSWSARPRQMIPAQE
jgi:hypothetical protein